MFVKVNGVKLYVDIEGPGLVPDGTRMRQKPTLLLLHGGPGADHSLFKPAFSALSDIAEIVYYDHRGCGRSEDGNPGSWTLAQWGDDVKGLCDALGMEKPIVYGVSFGGFVAQAYATRYPSHPAKLVLTSTAAKVDFPTVFESFARVGGEPARQAAQNYWLSPSAESRAAYAQICVPFYSRKPHIDPDWLTRAIRRNGTGLAFNGPANEHGRMDFRADLGRVECPVLIMAGACDPITPIAFSETILSCLPPDLGRLERFPDCGHGVVSDAPDRALALLREFILAGE